ncbi:hypothetical protein [Duganella sp. FT27W]|uniref:hypothetical protein n=1 Tax=Duganella sp. FT27W TaxID=2654636 RepID=UPI00128AE085|nr:hypothetical protein [Duganella sp. FT27W]MPQ56266.1 hypothetical protein [Duganella sp. FT27W]
MNKPLRLRPAEVLEQRLFMELINRVENAAEGADLDDPPAELYATAYRVGQLMESIGFAKTPAGLMMVVRDSDELDNIDNADAEQRRAMKAGMVQVILAMTKGPTK